MDATNIIDDGTKPVVSQSPKDNNKRGMDTPLSPRAGPLLKKPRVNTREGNVQRWSNNKKQQDKQVQQQNKQDNEPQALNQEQVQEAQDTNVRGENHDEVNDFNKDQNVIPIDVEGDAQNIVHSNVKGKRGQRGRNQFQGPSKQPRGRGFNVGGGKFRGTRRGGGGDDDGYGDDGEGGDGYYYHNGGPGNSRNNHIRNDEIAVGQRLRSFNGPTLELEEINEEQEIKFSGRNRLYVGNLPIDKCNKDSLVEMFKPFGEVSDLFMGPDKKFAFIKVDYRANAEKAKRTLDASMVNGRQLRVRFAPSATAVRVSNLNSFVSNELLYRSFEIFGPVERARVLVDERGNHMGVGIVEFTKKSTTNICLRMCRERCFFLTSSMRPCIVELKEQCEDADGLPEKALSKTNQYVQERSSAPRFADPNSFEHEYGSRWKDLFAMHSSKLAALKRDHDLEMEKLSAQLEYARFERETHVLRQELQKREAENERLKMEWEMRQNHSVELAMRENGGMQRRPNDMQNYMVRQEHPIRGILQERAAVLQQNLNGLYGKFGYSDRNFEANSSPFVVFEEENKEGKSGSVITNQIPSNDHFEDNNQNINSLMDPQINANIIQDNGGNQLWGRRNM